jgi:tetratricopeptide (TPR) repeat protein
MTSLGPKQGWVLLALLAILATDVVASAQQDKNRITYWRAKYRELKPTDDPRVSQARDIFYRLVQVAGSRPGVVPKLYITQRDPWNLVLPIALPDGWIVLSKGVLDICYREPSTGDDRLAFILAHEIAHQLSGDLWHMRFFQAMEAKTAQKAAPQAFRDDILRGAHATEHVMAKEIRADERGIIYAAMAGFNTQAIVTGDRRVNFFVDWVRALDPRRVQGGARKPMRPTPEERAEALKARLRQVVNQAAVFQAGLWWYYTGNYPQAIKAFEHFQEIFPGREVLHNLAASHHRLALHLRSLWKTDAPALPFRLALSVDADTRASRLYLENRAEASRGEQEVIDAERLFQEHLDEAIRLYREAIRLDAAYTPAARNLGAALIVRALHATSASRQADLSESIMTLSRARVHASKDVALLTNLGVAFFYEGQPEQAKSMMSQAVKLAPSHSPSVYNLRLITHIERHGSQTQTAQPQSLTSRATLKRAESSGLIERIQGLSVGSVLVASQLGTALRTFELSSQSFALTALIPGVVVLTQDGELLMAMAQPGYQGATAQALRIGSSVQDVLATYGEPSRRLDIEAGESWSYDPQGISLQLKDGRVASWLIY